MARSADQSSCFHAHRSLSGGQARYNSLAAPYICSLYPVTIVRQLAETRKPSHVTFPEPFYWPEFSHFRCIFVAFSNIFADTSGRNRVLRQFFLYWAAVPWTICRPSRRATRRGRGSVTIAISVFWWEARGRILRTVHFSRVSYQEKASTFVTSNNAQGQKRNNAQRLWQHKTPHRSSLNNIGQPVIMRKWRINRNILSVQYVSNRFARHWDPYPWSRLEVRINGRIEYHLVWFFSWPTQTFWFLWLLRPSETICSGSIRIIWK